MFEAMLKVFAMASPTYNDNTLRKAGWTLIGKIAVIELRGITFYYERPMKHLSFVYSRDIVDMDWFCEAYLTSDPVGLVKAAEENI